MRRAPRYFSIIFLAAAAFAQNSGSSSSADFSVVNSTTTVDLRAAVDGVPPSESAVESVRVEPLHATLPPPIKPAETDGKPEISKRQRNIWYALLASEHSGAFLDAWSTRQVISQGGRELDPVVRPFAHSPAIYPALQVAPFGVDYFATRLMHSRNRTLRKLWWVPQGVAAAGSLVCGTLNLSNRR